MTKVVDISDRGRGRRINNLYSQMDDTHDRIRRKCLAAENEARQASESGIASVSSLAAHRATTLTREEREELFPWRLHIASYGRNSPDQKTLVFSLRDDRTALRTSIELPLAYMDCAVQSLENINGITQNMPISGSPTLLFQDEHYLIQGNTAGNPNFCSTPVSTIDELLETTADFFNPQQTPVLLTGMNQLQTYRSVLREDGWEDIPNTPKAPKEYVVNGHGLLTVAEYVQLIRE